MLQLFRKRGFLALAKIQFVSFKMTILVDLTVVIVAICFTGNGLGCHTFHIHVMLDVVRCWSFVVTILTQLLDKFSSLAFVVSLLLMLGDI